MGPSRDHPHPRPEGGPPSGSRVAVGTMNFGKRTPAAEAQRIVGAALDRGVAWFDTANVYADGEAERILGRALGARRDAAVIATKVGLDRGGGRPEGLSRAAILRAIDGSLARLGTDRVDIYYWHAPDPAVPVQESLEVMGELLAHGKILAWGVSNHAAWQILELFHLADAAGIARPCVSQVLYNLLIRQIEVEYAPFTRRYPIHTTAYNPLAGGLLTERHAPSTAAAKPAKGTRFDGNGLYQRRYWTAPMFARQGELQEIAATAGLSLVELAYAWLAAQPVVSSVLVGPATVTHLEAALAAISLTLSPEVIRRVDEAHRAWRGTDTDYVRRC